MYTLPMSRSFRTLALSVAMLWALAPQLACFMPGQMTETEQQCCKEMANDCGGLRHVSRMLPHRCPSGCRNAGRVKPRYCAGLQRCRNDV